MYGGLIMLLRYVLNGETEIAEIQRMYHRMETGYFERQDGVTLQLNNINTADWLKLVANMFCDSRLSLPLDAKRTITIASFNKNTENKAL